jgi:hypothetical protein
MYYDLPKKDKKIARQLMDKGILSEFEQGLKRFDAILQDWKAGNSETRDSYHKLFTAVREFDKHIARRYDGIGGSRYLETVIIQLIDGLYDISEIDEFSPDAKETALRFVNLQKRSL